MFKLLQSNPLSQSIFAGGEVPVGLSGVPVGGASLCARSLGRDPFHREKIHSLNRVSAGISSRVPSLVASIGGVLDNPQFAFLAKPGGMVLV